MRRFAAPLFFALVFVACAFGAASSGALTSAGNGSAATGPQPVTPVLSARRAPSLFESLAADASMRTQLDAILARSPANTCLSVQADGRLIYERNGATVLLPASNEKLLTATAALKVLGPDTKLRTTVVSKAKPDKAGIVHGDVYLVGGGDPLLGTADFRDTLLDPTLSTSLESLADAVVASGVHHISGRLIGDESRYDSQRAIASWPLSYTTDHEAGPLSALVVNDNWTAFPTKLQPATKLAPAPNPPQHAAEVLVLLLGERGVTVDGGSAAGTAPSGTDELAHLDSLPVSQLVHEMLTISDNLTAELLLKELGHTAGSGTTAKGLTVLQPALTSLGLPLAGTVQTDGSGLDRGDRVTCDFLMRVLHLAGPSSPMGLGLPIAGRTGTLKPRFLGTIAMDHLHAKTGTLDDVSALSGFVNTIPGSTITFSYVANGHIVMKTQLKVEEDLGVALTAYPQGVMVSAIGPEPTR